MLNLVSFQNATAGDILTFGAYPQTADGTDKTPIQWDVLHNSGKELLILSKYILDCRRYHGDYTNTSWKECDLRKWLNGEFYQTTFQSTEKQAILVSHCTDNGEDSPDTDDRIFLLSVKEAREWTGKVTLHSSGVSRRAIGTEFARVKKADGCKLYMYDKRGNEDYVLAHGHEVGCSWWWLRTRGQKEIEGSGGEKMNDASRAFFVGTRSSIRSYARVNLSGYGVRPALRLSLECKTRALN